MIRALRRLAPFGLPIASVLLLISGPALGAAPDDEEYRNAIISVVLHARAILDGVYPYWTSALAFGVPHPLNPAPLLHPLMPLFGLLAPEDAVRLLYVLHAALGAAGCWWLVRTLGAGRWAAALAASTWTLSTPSQNYMLTDFWPAEFVIWSLAPYLLLTAIRVLDAPASVQPWIDAVAFGLVAGLMWSNGHAGYVPIFFVALAIFVFTEWRRAWRVWPALALATCVGAVIAAPTLAQLLIEVRNFPPLRRSIPEGTTGFSQLIDLSLRPVHLRPWSMFSDLVTRGTRVPFFGGPMFVLALANVAAISGSSRYRRGLVLAFASGFALMLMPGLNRFGAFSGIFFFRDPMILFGLVLGALAWQTLVNRHPRAASAVAVLQIAVLLLAAWPFVRIAHGGRRIPDTFLHQSKITTSLVEWSERIPGRWYIAPDLDAQVRSGRMFLDGLWTNVWVYRGLPVVNGTFKAVSVDPLYPSESLPYGRIQGHPVTVASTSTLDVLGISAVLATASEPVAPTLEEVARFPTTYVGEMRLLRNPGAWPGAAFVDQRVVENSLVPLNECTLGGALCLDFSPVASATHDTNVHVSRAHGAIRIRFQADPAASRSLLVSEMYRPGWRARSESGQLPPVVSSNGLISVRVPAGVEGIELQYRPTLLVILTWLSTAVLLLAVAVVLLALIIRREPLPRHLYRLLSRYVGYHLPPDSRIVEFAPHTPLLAQSLGRSSMRVVFPASLADAHSTQLLDGWEALREFEPDRIILNGTFHYEEDIQALLERLHTLCRPNTRVLVIYYSSLWKPLVALGWRLGLTTKRPDHNWVTPSDVANLLRLTGYEIVTESHHVLMPVGIPFVSAFVNRWLAPLPVLEWFALVNLALVRIVPSSAVQPMSVSVIVPARNERGNIPRIVERVPQMGPNDEIVFVEGHSSDGTWDEIQSVMARFPDRRIRAFQQSGRGKGDAVRVGFSAATGDCLMILDADLTVPPEDLPKFYRALSSGVGEFINGSRLIYPMEKQAMRFANMVGNKFFAMAFSYLVGQPLKDTLCGTKVLTREHYEQIARGRLYFGDFDPFGDFDLLFGAAKLGLRIVELPVRYRERTYGATNIHRWTHGWLLLRMTAFAARKMKFI